MCRVKLPKSFLAVNLSDAFSFEEQERLASDNEGLEMKTIPPKDILAAAARPIATESEVAGDGAAPPHPGKVVNPM